MQKLKNNEFGYLGNPSVKRDGVETEFTKEDILEYQRCMRDPAYFARTYIKIINLDEGLVPFDLYPYQEKMFKHFNDNRFSIVLACRQSGKSISSVVAVWVAREKASPFILSVNALVSISEDAATVKVWPARFIDLATSIVTPDSILSILFLKASIKFLSFGI